jgi:hypothetical protein
MENGELKTGNELRSLLSFGSSGYIAGFSILRFQCSMILNYPFSILH